MYNHILIIKPQTFYLIYVLGILFSSEDIYVIDTLVDSIKIFYNASDLL